MKVNVTISREIELTPADLGQAFIEMDSDSQTTFFVAAAKHASENWDRNERALEAQGYEIGRHLRTCKCSSEAARNLVEMIAYGMEEKEASP